MAIDWNARDRVHAIEQFEKAYRDSAGIYRWSSNDQCPFYSDMTRHWVEAGLITQDDADRTDAARTAEGFAIMQRYAEQMAGRSPEAKAEDHAEMLAAFGPGETVVNVITGERTYT